MPRSISRAVWRVAKPAVGHHVTPPASAVPASVSGRCSSVTREAVLRAKAERGAGSAIVADDVAEIAARVGPAVVQVLTTGRVRPAAEPPAGLRDSPMEEMLRRFGGAAPRRAGARASSSRPRAAS